MNTPITAFHSVWSDTLKAFLSFYELCWVIHVAYIRRIFLYKFQYADKWVILHVYLNTVYKRKLRLVIGLEEGVILDLVPYLSRTEIESSTKPLKWGTLDLKFHNTKNK